MMRKFRLPQLLLVATAVFSSFFVACSDKDDSAGNATVMVRMTDAPGDFDEVNIEVLDVLIKDSSDPDEKGWVSIGDPAFVGEHKTYNLLQLTGGVNALLSNYQIPAGKLGQIRLLLGDENSVVVDKEIYPLDTPSAQQSGLKLKVNETLEAGITYDFLLDFDVAKSIVGGDKGKYSLKPVIRVSTSVADGAIKGTALLLDAQNEPYQVEASIQVGSEIVTAYTNDQGVFQLNGVPPGTYDVTLTPDPASQVPGVTVTGVVVTSGQTTDMGVVLP